LVKFTINFKKHFILLYMWPPHEKISSFAAGYVEDLTIQIY